MKLKAYNKRTRLFLDLDLYDEFGQLVCDEHTPEELKQDVVFLRYAGQLCGIDIYEGDIVQTSDGHLCKEINWVEKDYGFGSLYHLARYVEKTGCTISIVGHVNKIQEEPTS